MQYQEITCQEFNDKYYLDLCEEPPIEWAEGCQKDRWDKDSFEFYHISGLGYLAIYQLR